MLNSIMKSIKNNPIIIILMIISGSLKIVAEIGVISENPIFSDLVTVLVFFVVAFYIIKSFIKNIIDDINYSKNKLTRQSSIIFVLRSQMGLMFFSIILIGASIILAGRESLQLAKHLLPPWKEHDTCFRIVDVNCRLCPILLDGMERPVEINCTKFADGFGLIQKKLPRWSTYKPVGFKTMCRGEEQLFSIPEREEYDLCPSID